MNETIRATSPAPEGTTPAVNGGVNRRLGLRATHLVEIEITSKSILRLLLAALLTYAAIMLWPIMKLCILAILLAVALHPIAAWVTRKGGPQWLGVLAATATLLVIVVACTSIIAPLVFRQGTLLGESLPRVREQVLSQMPATGIVRHALENSLSPVAVADSKAVLEKVLILLETTLGGLVYFVVVIALAIYLLIDGPRAVRWLMVFFPLGYREKIAETLNQVSRLISAYVTGQFIVSGLAAAYLFAVLTVLGVPMALLLGIIAGICDVIPIVGFFVAVFMAMIMGLTVSPGTAALIFVCYGAYHLFENFFIIPRVYGKKLKLSKLAVPLAIAAGGVLAGVVGAIAVLPLVAAYPVIERLWLASKLEPDTLKAHEGSF